MTKETIIKTLKEECKRMEEIVFILDCPSDFELDKSICFINGGDYINIHSSIYDALNSCFSISIDVWNNGFEPFDEYLLERILYSMKNNQVEIQIKRI